MARIFNIYFTYDDSLHSAIVSVHATPLSTEYILGNVDAHLRDLLPGDRIVLEGEALRFRSVGPHHPPQLMEAIINSLTNHLVISRQRSANGE